MSGLLIKQIPNKMHGLNVFAKKGRSYMTGARVLPTLKRGQLKTQNGEGSTAKRNQRRRNKKE